MSSLSPQDIFKCGYVFYPLQQRLGVSIALPKSGTSSPTTAEPPRMPTLPSEFKLSESLAVDSVSSGRRFLDGRSSLWS